MRTDAYRIHQSMQQAVIVFIGTIFNLKYRDPRAKKRMRARINAWNLWRGVG
jgi:hypothetical protein